MTDFTGIVHGRLDKGGISAIPGDPFACILSVGKLMLSSEQAEDVITSYLLYSRVRYLRLG